MATQSWVCVIFSFLFVVVGLLATMGLVAGALALRGSRRCPRCQAQMVLAGEDEVTAVLDPGQKAEYDVGAVEWDVWHCANCAHVQRDRRVVEPSQYLPCPECNYRTLPVPTGPGRRPGVCVFCGNTG